MASITRTVSNFSLTSSWTVSSILYPGNDQYYISYGTPSTGRADKTFDLSAIPTGSKITAASLAVKTNGEGDSAATRNGTSYNITNDHTGSNAVNVTSWFSSLTSFGSESIRFSFKAYGGTGSVSNGSSTTVSRTCNVSNVALTIIYTLPNSTGSLNKTSADAGTSVTLTITPSDTSYTHKVTWSFGSHSQVQTVAAGTKTTSYTVPLSWLDAIPNATSGTVSVKLETLNGSTVLGSASYSFTLIVPSSVTPSAGTLSAARVDNGVPSSWGIYVQRVSGAKLTLSEAAGKYGSTISSIKYEGWGGSNTTTATTYTTPAISSSGTVTLKATVTDSRGRTASATTSISVVAYSTPTFTATSAYRCNSSGTATDDGTYIRVSGTFSYSTVSGKNAITTSSGYKRTTASSYTGAGTFTSGTARTIGGGNISADYGYNVYLKVEDSLGNSAQQTLTVSAAQYTLHFRNGGKNVGIVTAADQNYALKVGGTLYATGKVYSEGTEVATVGNINLSASNITSGTLAVARGGTGQTSLAALRNAAGLGNTTGAVPVANGGTGQTTIDGVKSAFGISKSALGFVQQQALYQSNNNAVSANRPMFNVTLSLASGDTWEGIAILGVGGSTQTDFLAFFDADYTVGNYRSFMRYNASSTQSGKNMFGYAQASGAANKSITHFTIQKLGDVVYMQGQTMRGGNAMADFTIVRSGITGNTFQIVPSAAVVAGHGSMLRMTKIY